MKFDLPAILSGIVLSQLALTEAAGQSERGGTATVPAGKAAVNRAGAATTRTETT